MIPVNEQETVIQFNRDDRGCKIWTSDSTMMTKLDKRCRLAPDFYTMVKETRTQDGEIAGKFYEIKDKSLLSFRTLKTERVMTDEQRKAAAERLRNARRSRNENKGD